MLASEPVQENIHPKTYIGKVALTTASLERMLPFYVQILGLQLLERSDGTARLGAPDGHEIVRLVEDSVATQPSRRATGLYHMAIRVPSRADLARALHRLAAAQWPFQGFADHGVSEAAYLADPDGNGIEIYRDRPRTEWPYRDGSLQMVTDPLDVDGIMDTLRGQDEPEVDAFPVGTDMGHIHLQVADIAASERFYVGVLGFDLVQRFGSSAGFVSAGGYHHHIGFNTWHSARAQPPPPGSTGLRYFTICYPSAEALEFSTRRIRAAGIELREIEGDTQPAYRVADPSGNQMLLMVVHNHS